MFPLLLFIPLALFIALFIVLDRRDILSLRTVLKIVVIALALTYGFRMVNKDALNDTFNLFIVDLDTDLHAPGTWLLSRGMSVWMIFLRWFTVVSIAWARLGSFYKQRIIYFIVAVLGTFSAVFNIVFFEENIVATTGSFIGELQTLHFPVQFAVETVLLGIAGGLYVALLMKERPRFDKAFFAKAGFVFVFSALALMPLTLLYNFFGNYGEKPLDFTPSHVFILLLPFFAMPIIYFIFRDKDSDDIYLMLLFLVFANIIQFFTHPSTGLRGLPLHLCNTATILMLVAFVFKWNGFFYFNYFVNVIGALMALLLPDYDHDLFSLSVIRFVLTHYFPLMVPILAVALKAFPRPQLKNMLQAIWIFTIYFIAVVFINTWFRNYPTGAGTDYFFTYSTHISSFFGDGAVDLHTTNKIDIEFRGLTFTFYYVFQSIYYVGFVFLMFVNWFIYDRLFQAFDNLSRLLGELKDDARVKAAFKKAHGGRSIDEPLDVEAKDMIRIENFSKRYKNSGILAVDDFSLEVNRGEVVGFLGQNGAGKSTTIKSLVGIQAVTSGDMKVCGYSIRSQKNQVKKRIGFVSDNHAVYERMTGREYINYVADLFDVDEHTRTEHLNTYLDKLALTHAIDHEIKSYSHGMKQKLVVIASLVHQPDAWILDEPLTGLDPNSAFEIKTIMREYANSGRIVFFSSHVIEVVEKVCDRIAIIHEGSLLGIYDMQDIRDKDIRIEDLYMSTKPWEEALEPK